MQRMDHLTDGAIRAIEARGIDSEVAVRLGVVSAKARGGDDREWIAFRHDVDGGDMDHWQYRTVSGSKQFLQSKGTERRLWNGQVIRDQTLADHPLIITEGQMDALAIIGAGFPRVVSVPDGAPTTAGSEAKAKYSYLEAAGIEDVREIILATDNDNPGKALMHDLAIRLGRARCKWLRYPRGSKDACDIVREHGVDGLVKLLAGAKWMRMPGLYTLADLPPEPDEQPMVLGMPGLDDLWKPSVGRMTVVTGIPGHGKSTFIVDAICRAVEQHGVVAAIGSFEMSARSEIVPMLQRWHLRCDPDRANDDRRRGTQRWISDHFVFIQHDDDGDDEPCTVDWFCDRAAAAVIRHNASVIVLDPWNEIDHRHRPAEVNMTEYVGVKLAQLRRHAKEHRYHLIVAAHPAKMQRDKDGKSHPPTGYDLADSANFFNKCDSGLSIFRRDDDATRIGCWKCKREGLIGRRGSMMFTLDMTNHRYMASPNLAE